MDATTGLPPVASDPDLTDEQEPVMAENHESGTIDHRSAEIGCIHKCRITEIAPASPDGQSIAPNCCRPCNN
jgi:hypothetical protein